MEMSQFVTCSGVALVALGLLIECVAFAGMASYRVRQTLYRFSIDNPLAFQSVGCCVFLAGGGVLIFGQWLRS
jgi:hypothetical protein